MHMRTSKTLIGCLGVSTMLVCSVAGLAQSAPPQSVAQPAGTPIAVAPAADSMSALTKEIRAVNAEIQELVRQISQLQFARPAPLAKDASEDAKKQYAQAMAAWEKQKDILEKRIEQLRARVEELQARLKRLEAQLPSAQSSDQEKNRTALENAKKRLEQAHTTLSSSANAIPPPSSGKPAARPGTSIVTPKPGP
jgi:predicted ribosome quality control (RQC) complex YloA/Tae2 family protein